MLSTWSPLTTFLLDNNFFLNFSKGGRTQGPLNTPPWDVAAPARLSTGRRLTLAARRSLPPPTLGTTASGRPRRHYIHYRRLCLGRSLDGRPPAVPPDAAAAVPAVSAGLFARRRDVGAVTRQRLPSVRPSVRPFVRSFVTIMSPAGARATRASTPLRCFVVLRFSSCRLVVGVRPLSLALPPSPPPPAFPHGTRCPDKSFASVARRRHLRFRRRCDGHR